MNDIKKKYIDIFFGSLTDEEKTEVYFEQYMWHVYSYKKLNALEGWKAIKEFKKNVENDVYVLFQDNDEVVEMKNITFDELVYNTKNKEIWNYGDCYIVDKNFKWTFIYTHETQYDGEEIINLNSEHNIYYIGPFFDLAHKNN